jgi:hypothetical protein
MALLLTAFFDELTAFLFGGMTRTGKKIETED